MMEVMNALQNPEQTVCDTVVVDTVGELYRRLLEEFSNRSIRPSLPTYGEVSVQVERFCRALCMVPHVNTVICAHDMMMQNGEEVVFIPYTGTKAGSADMGNKLASMVDIVGYTGVIEQEGGGKQAVAQLIPLKGRNGGDRFDCLGDWRPLDISEWITTIAAHERGEEVVRYDLSANVGTTEAPAPEPQPEVEEPAQPQPVRESPMTGEAKATPRTRRKAA
jgi:molybdopterin converting factor small subunit